MDQTHQGQIWPTHKNRHRNSSQIRKEIVYKGCQVCKGIPGLIGFLGKYYVIKKTPTKKVYMLAEFEPSVDLTGGAWYTDQSMDEEFINLLSAQIKRFIDAKTRPTPGSIFPSTFTPPTSVEEIHSWVIKSGVTTQILTIPDVETLTNRLVYDGVVYKSDDDTFRACNDTVGPNALTDAPCGTCPVFPVCSSTGVVSPQNCEYLTEWLSR